MAKLKPAFAYARVSSEGQGADDRHGLERQEDTIRAYAKRRYDVREVFRETWTGTDSNRPQFDELLVALISNGVRFVLVEDLSRFAREPRVQEELLDRLAGVGAQLIEAATGQNISEQRKGAEGEFLVDIRALVSRLEKRRVVTRLEKARKAIRDKGKRCEGRKPYGARAGEQEALKRLSVLARRQRDGTRRTLQELADAMTSEGHPTRGGNKQWAISTIRNLLNRAAQKRAKKGRG